MSNVFQFPKSPAVQAMQAEEYLREQIRMNLGAACGLLLQPASNDTMCDVLDMMTLAASLIDSYVAITGACK